MNPNQKLANSTETQESIKETEKTSTLKYTVILVIVTVLLSVAYLFYDIYQQKKQNEQFQAEALAQEKQDQITIYKETLHHEKVGFEQIIAKNYPQAITSFYKASSLTPSFNDVEEIASLLSQNKMHMDDPKIKMTLLKEISSKHAKHAPTGFVTSIQSQINELERFSKNKDEKEQALKRSRYHEQEGFTHLLNEEYNSALRSFQKANQFTSSFHDVPKLISLLSQYQYEMVEPKVRIKVLTQIVQNYSTHAPDGFKETIDGRIRYGQQINTSKKALIYEQNGFKYILEKKYDKAIESFNNAKKLNPALNDTEAISKLLSKHKTTMQQFKVKRKVLKEIMDKHAKNAPANFVPTITSELLQEQKDIQALAYEQQGFHYLMKSNFIQAMSAFSKASRANPSFHDTKALSTLLTRYQEKLDEDKTKQKILNEILKNHTKYAPNDFVYSIKKQLKLLNEAIAEVDKAESIKKQQDISQQPLIRVDYSMTPPTEN